MDEAYLKSLSKMCINIIIQAMADATCMNGKPDNLKKGWMVEAKNDALDYLASEDFKIHYHIASWRYSIPQPRIILKKILELNESNTPIDMRAMAGCRPDWHFEGKAGKKKRSDLEIPIPS